MHFSLKNILRTALFGSLLAGQSMASHAQENAPEKQEKQPVLFQMIGYQPAGTTTLRKHSDVRTILNKLHDSASHYLGSKAKVYSYNYAARRINFENMLEDIALESQNANVLPITLLIWHGTAAMKPVRRKKYVDTLLYDNRGGVADDQRGPEQDGIFLKNLFRDIAHALKERPGVNIVTDCHGAAGIMNTSWLPVNSETFFASRATDVTVTDENHLVKKLGQDSDVRMNTAQQCIGGVIKHLTRGYGGCENKPVVAVTTHEPQKDLYFNGLKFPQGPHAPRVIDIDAQMENIPDISNESEMQDIIHELAFQDENQYNEGNDDVFNEAYLTLRQMNQDKKKYDAVDENAFNAATIYPLGSFILFSYRKNLQMMCQKVSSEQYAIMRILTYEVCRRHLDKMPTGTEYALQMNVIPDARRKTVSSRFSATP